MTIVDFSHYSLSKSPQYSIFDNSGLLVLLGADGDAAQVEVVGSVSQPLLQTAHHQGVTVHQELVSKHERSSGQARQVTCGQTWEGGDC